MCLSQLFQIDAPSKKSRIPDCSPLFGGEIWDKRGTLYVLPFTKTGLIYLIFKAGMSNLFLPKQTVGVLTEQ